MRAWDRSVTSASDTVVEIQGVSKTFRQRQRSERLTEAFRSLLRPKVKEVRALQKDRKSTRLNSSH